jgi:hypothetical protein
MPMLMCVHVTGSDDLVLLFCPALLLMSGALRGYTDGKMPHAPMVETPSRRCHLSSMGSQRLLAHSIAPDICHVNGCRQMHCW